MRLDLFLQPFFIAFVVTSCLSFLFLLVPGWRGRLSRRGSRHAAKARLSRLGGVALATGFLSAVLLDKNLVISREIFGLLAGSVLVVAFGVWDDVQELGWRIQGVFQVVIAAILFLFGIRITALKIPFGETLFLSYESAITVIAGFILLLLWMVLVLNAVNWLDGLDGLLGSVSLITFCTVFFLSLKPEVNQPPVAILAVTALAAVLGFLFFNLHPARLLAGTSGSLFIGFLIAVLAIIAGTKIATALLVLSLPVADALWVIVERLRAGVSIFEPDQRHLHYKLRHLGWSEGQIAWFFALVTGLIALLALSTETLGKFIASLLVFSLIFSVLFFVAHKESVGNRANKKA